MKTLILYATKYGATLKIAEILAKNIGGAALHNIGRGAAPSLSGYDCVVLGSPLTAGMINGKVKSFAANHAAELTAKRLGLFVSGLQPQEEAAYFAQNFPASLLAAARAKAFLGGIFDPEKCGFVARRVMKAAAKLDSYTSAIDETQIKAFSDLLLG